MQISNVMEGCCGCGGQFVWVDRLLWWLWAAALKFECNFFDSPNFVEFSVQFEVRQWLNLKLISS
jgi:hypothetical protein